jgi:hypothetical protein
MNNDILTATAASFAVSKLYLGIDITSPNAFKYAIASALASYGAQQYQASNPSMSFGLSPMMMDVVVGVAVTLAVRSVMG